MSKPLFGQILDPDFKPTRDAVHVPIIPVLSTGTVYRGEKLTLTKYPDGSIFAAVVHGDSYLAIADPFIPGKIEPGQLFYAWLRPESAQKLWHEWTHRELDT